jgi:hypothetical protein
MSGAVCPACGVAVVPGYVRCPKCHRQLPRFSRNSSSPVGGTSLVVPKQGSPLLAIAVAVLVGGGFIAFFALRGGKQVSAAPPPPATAPIVAPAPTPAEVPASVSPAPIAPAAPRGPNAETVVGEFRRTLERQRLWSTIRVLGPRVEIRSTLCNDAGMKAAIGTVTPSLKAAGLTELRCVEQSGAVVLDREL